MFKTIEQLREEFRKAKADALAICDAAIAEERDLTAEEKQNVDNLVTAAKGFEADIRQKQAEEQTRQQILALGGDLDLGDNGSGNNGKGQHGLVRAKSLGQQFVEAETFRLWMKQIAPNGRVPDSAKGLNSGPVEFKGFGMFGQKDLITGSSDTSAGAFVNPDYTGIYEPLGRYPLTLRDLVSARQTMSDTVEFVRQVTQVTQAAPVPEANVTDYTGATGQVQGKKPEGGMTFERVTETVKTIAVWVPATKRALSDASQLRGLIDQELREDLAEELEDQMLNGDGVGENFTGIVNTAGTLVQAYTTDILTTCRKAITNLRANGKQMPSAWLFHPNDWETIDLLKNDQGNYYWGGPMAQGQKTLWGVPVVESFHQTEGQAILANWRKAVVWDREQATISVSDSHEDFFIRNMVAILGEMRAAFGVIRPSAFVEVDLTAGS